MTDETASQGPPWLDYEGASSRLRDRFNVELTPRTIANKVSAGEIPSRAIAGKTRIHESDLDAWALGEPVKAEATS